MNSLGPPLSLFLSPHPSLHLSLSPPLSPQRSFLPFVFETGLVLPVWLRMTLNSGSTTSTSQMLEQKVSSIACHGFCSFSKLPLPYPNLSQTTPPIRRSWPLQLAPLVLHTEREGGGQSHQGLVTPWCMSLAPPLPQEPATHRPRAP